VAKSQGISLKKRYGQHFLRDERYPDIMFDAVSLTPESSVLEIGCGDGFLTRAILHHPIARLWVYEIDEEWASYVASEIKDGRLTIFTENFLDADFERLRPHTPWTILANLPYQVTFPILHRFQEHRELFKEGVVMVQEEVAQKIVKTSGRGYGFVSLFFQHYFEWTLLEKVPPDAFYPPPKVYSRLLYFKPIENPIIIPHEERFWAFVKKCFAQPRRTLRNNVKGIAQAMEQIPASMLDLRAQQMSMKDFLEIWQKIQK
jgi:16S rRNA (adenine1518-N6/adenine1519-N6)-dimethyltransferase